MLPLDLQGQADLVLEQEPVLLGHLCQQGQELPDLLVLQVPGPPDLVLVEAGLLREQELVQQERLTSDDMLRSDRDK